MPEEIETPEEQAFWEANNAFVAFAKAHTFLEVIAHRSAEYLAFYEHTEAAYRAWFAADPERAEAACLEGKVFELH